MTGVELAVIGSTAITLGDVALVAGALAGAAGAISSGRAARQAAEQNALAAERNARISRQQARAEAEAQQRDARRRVGAARAAYGASGVTLEGSPLDVLEESASLAELDKQQILYNGELRAMGYTDTASLDRAGGRNAERQGYFGAASTLLLGASKVGANKKEPPKVPGSAIRADTLISEDFY